jgi:hypothetical protein
MGTKSIPNRNQIDTKWDDDWSGFDFMSQLGADMGDRFAQKPRFHDTRSAGAFGDRRNLNREMANPNRNQMGTKWELFRKSVRRKTTKLIRFIHSLRQKFDRDRESNRMNRMNRLVAFVATAAPETTVCPSMQSARGKKGLTRQTFIILSK